MPLLLAALFCHGTVGSFTGGPACHELSHRGAQPRVRIDLLHVFRFALARLGADHPPLSRGG